MIFDIRQKVNHHGDTEDTEKSEKKLTTEYMEHTEKTKARNSFATAPEESSFWN